MLLTFAQTLLVGAAAAHGTTESHVKIPPSPMDHFRTVLAERQAISNISKTSLQTTDLLLAEQCAQTLVSWASAFTNWSYMHSSYYVTTETYKQPVWATAVVPSYSASSLTTLCDGHPRVVGFAGSTPLTTTIGTSGAFTMSAYDVTQYVYNIPPYPIPQAPCTISDEDCQALYEKNSSLVFASYDPICNISSTSKTTLTYATDAAGHTCSQCYIRASSARLLYWPVRTVDGTGDMCGSSIQTQGLPRTGDGPNTFVTDGITITSPSVGIYLASVSRVDQCYTTLASTIVVVPASEVMSARGARALYDHEPFRYQDLNYKCQPANSSDYWIQDEPGNDCYQQVPAVAYFSGESAFNWDEYYPTAFGPLLTIGPDYRPYILPPESMTDWANSIYSTSGCQIQVNGVWDPPRALLPGTTVLTPVVAWETATSANTASTRSPSPAEVEHSQLAQTIVSQVVSTATAIADTGGSVQTSRAESSGLTTVIITSQIRTALSSLAESKSTDVVTAERGSSFTIADTASGTTSNTISTSANVKTTALFPEDQSGSAEWLTSGKSSSRGSTISEVVMPTTGTQNGLSMRSSVHNTMLSSTHGLSHAAQSSSPSRSAVSTITAFQGQATRLEITSSLASLLLLFSLWLWWN